MVRQYTAGEFSRWLAKNHPQVEPDWSAHYWENQDDTWGPNLGPLLVSAYFHRWLAKNHPQVWPEWREYLADSNQGVA